MIRGLGVMLGSALLMGCTEAPPSVSCLEVTASEHAPNFLVVVLDDVGLDKMGAYGLHPTPPERTPTLDALAARSVRFTRAYGNPVCSQSRASLLTGRHASRTGVPRWGDSWATTFDLPLAELTLAEMLGRSCHGYSTAALGKWHLTRFTRAEPGMHPLRSGFERHRGSLANPAYSYSQPSAITDYFTWEKNVDGEQSYVETYMTTDTTDEAILAVDELPEPWFLWVAYNGVHSPQHVPPADLVEEQPSESASQATLFDAMLEALDTELGRLLDHVEQEAARDTYIVLIGDNGSPNYAIRYPWDYKRGKGTIYEGGVRVPFMVAGPGIEEPGAEADAFVHFVDLLPTVAELADIDATTLYDDHDRPREVVLDGRSFASVLADPDDPGTRELVYTEQFYPGGGAPQTLSHRMVRDDTHKYAEFFKEGVLTERFFVLDPDEVDEGEDLLESGEALSAEDAAALAELREELDRHKRELIYVRPEPD